MKHLRLLPAILVLLLTAMQSQAQSLVELYNAAKKYDATYLSAVAQYEANRARADQALAGVLPRAALTASTQRTGVDVEPFGTGANTSAATSPYTRYFSTHATTLSASQPLYNPANRLFYEQSRKQLAQAVQALVSAEQDLLIKTSQAYFDVLGSQDSLSFVKAQKAAVSEQLAAAKRNFEVGTATITDANDAQARHDLAVSQEIGAQNDLEVKKQAMRQIIGSVPPALAKISRGFAPQLPAPSDMEAWVQQSAGACAQIKVAQLTLDVATQEVSKNRGGHLPTLDAVASYADAAQGAGIQGGVGFDSTTRYIGLQLAVPIYQGGLVNSKIREALANQEKARQDLENARRAVAQNTRAAYLGVTSGVAQIKALRSEEHTSELQSH